MDICLWFSEINNCYNNIIKPITYIGILTNLIIFCITITIITLKIRTNKWIQNGYYENNFIGILICNITGILYLLSHLFINIYFIKYLFFELNYFFFFIMICIDFNISLKFKNNKNNLLTRYIFYISILYHIFFVWTFGIISSIKNNEPVFLGIYFVLWSINWLFYAINYLYLENSININHINKNRELIPTIETELIYRNKWACIIGTLIWLYNGLFILIDYKTYSSNYFNNIFISIILFILIPLLSCLSIISYYLYKNYGDNIFSYIFIPRNMKFNNKLQTSSSNL